MRTDHSGSPGLGRQRGAGLWVQRRASSVILKKSTPDDDKVGQVERPTDSDRNPVSNISLDLWEESVYGLLPLDDHNLVLRRRRWEPRVKLGVDDCQVATVASHRRRDLEQAARDDALDHA